MGFFLSWVRKLLKTLEIGAGPLSVQLAIMIIRFPPLSPPKTNSSFSGFYNSCSDVPNYLRPPIFFFVRDELFTVLFLDTFSHLYKRVCPSVRPSVRPAVILELNL